MGDTRLDAPADAATLLARLHHATNTRDIDAIVACFAADYVNETPAHPARGFTGADQVRRNWEQILAALPDLRTRTMRSVVDGDTVWAEQEHTGTRPDGTTHLLRGVVVFTVREGSFSHASFYLEPVVDDGEAVSGAVSRQLATGARP